MLFVSRCELLNAESAFLWDVVVGKCAGGRLKGHKFAKNDVRSVGASMNWRAPSESKRMTEAKTLLLLKPRGFCAGVVRAIDIVRIALETFGPPIYVRKEIVHNKYVVEDLKGKGAIFVDDVEEVPNGERVIYSAHGVAPSVREASKLRQLRVIDATCPLVTKVHVEAIRFAKDGYSLILIGHLNHDEIVGTLGEAHEGTQCVSNPEQVA